MRIITTTLAATAPVLSPTGTLILAVAAVWLLGLGVIWAMTR